MNSITDTQQQPNPLAADLDHILAHTDGIWEDLRDARLFITGGTGFFGRWILESFAWANDRFKLNASAVVLTRDYGAFQRKAPKLADHPAIMYHGGDVRNFDFPDGEFSYIIHAATESTDKSGKHDPRKMFDAIVEGARRTLDFSVHCKAKKYLLTSSGAVYGRQPSEIAHISEEYQGGPDTMDPNAAYAEGKRAAELLCMLNAKENDIEAKIARCFAFVGPHLALDAHFAVGNFIRDALNGGPIQVNGDGTPFRSYLYAADLAIWLWTILARGESCRVYNVGSEEDVTIAALAATVAQIVQRPIEVKIARQSEPNKPPERYVPSTKRAQIALGLKQIVPLRDAIERTMRHAQLNRTIVS